MANYNIDAIYNGSTSLPGTERVRIDSSGNIGIGTATPSTKLHIYENANRVTYISQNNNHTARFEAYGTATAIDTTASNGIFFRINSGDIVKFAADGNVGIGTSTAGAPIHIYRASNPWIRLNGGGNYSYIQLDDGTSYGYLLKNTSSDTSNGALAGALYTYTDSGKAFQHIHSGTPLFTILSGGNVGIGTSGPSTLLQLRQTSASHQIFSINRANSATAAIYIGNDSSDNAIIASNNTALRLGKDFTGTFNEYARIDSNGNLGIGTSSPSNKLHVWTGTVQVSGFQSIAGGPLTFLRSDYNGSAAVQINFLNINPSNGYDSDLGIQLMNTGGSMVDVLRIKGSTGNVGIGTTNPGAKLVVIGETQISSNSAYTTHLNYQDSGINFISMANGGYTDFRGSSNNVTTMRVKGDGNVGIGTTSPAAKFQVGTHSTGDAGNGDNSANVRIGAASAGARVYGLTLANTATATVGNDSSISFIVAGNYSATGIISTILRNTTTAASDLVFTNYNNGLNERMRIQYDGNIGIGTTSVGNKLYVNGDGYFASTLYIADNTALNFGNISQIYHNSSRSATQFTGTGGADTMCIKDSNGYVGIGTTSPNRKLQVDAGTNGPALRLTNTNSNSGIELITAASTYSWLLGAQYNVGGAFEITPSTAVGGTTFSTPTAVFLQTGNVGIGTTSPNAKLVIDSGEPRFRLNISGTNHIILNHDGSTAVLRTESNTPFTFGTNGTEKMRIAAGGNVGIGTSNPISLLQIAGTTSMFPTYDSVTGYSYFLRMGYDTSGSYDYTIKRNGTTGFLEFNGTQGSPYVSYVFAGGDVYSGASGGTVGGFYFNSSSHGIRRATGTNDVYCFTTSGTLYLGAGGSSTTHVRVLSGGDVGIGVSPSYKLDVNGNIHGTGFPTSSDVRFKKNITPLQNSLEKIKKLQGVKYEWNEFVNSRRDGYKLNIPIIGLIAQDVEQVVPEIVDHWKLSDDCQDARSIDYPRLIPLLIEAIKEQQNQIEELRNEIKSLKSN